MTKQDNMELQYNYSTNEEYKGRNQTILCEAKNEGKFLSNAWLTFLQAKSEGLKVKKGSKGVHIMKQFGTITTENEKGETKVRTIPTGYAIVFNFDQTEEV